MDPSVWRNLPLFSQLDHPYWRLLAAGAARPERNEDSGFHIGVSRYLCRQLRITVSHMPVRNDVLQIVIGQGWDGWRFGAGIKRGSQVLQCRSMLLDCCLCAPAHRK
jgi:hypothetical protein